VSLLNIDAWREMRGGKFGCGEQWLLPGWAVTACYLQQLDMPFELFPYVRDLFVIWATLGNHSFGLADNSFESM
jgi:hypothetical protein